MAALDRCCSDSLSLSLLKGQKISSRTSYKSECGSSRCGGGGGCFHWATPRRPIALLFRRGAISLVAITTIIHSDPCLCMVLLFFDPFRRELWDVTRPFSFQHVLVLNDFKCVCVNILLCVQSFSQWMQKAVDTSEFHGGPCRCLLESNNSDPPGVFLSPSPTWTTTFTVKCLLPLSFVCPSAPQLLSVVSTEAELTI